MSHERSVLYTSHVALYIYVRIKVERQYQPLQVRSCYININNKSLLRHRAIMNSAQLAHIPVCIAVMLLLGFFVLFWGAKINIFDYIEIEFRLEPGHLEEQSLWDIFFT